MGTAPKNLYVVLLAGGSGTRLWPSSRKKLPKQFTKIFGRQTLFQQTIHRVKMLVPLSRVLIITNYDYVDDIKRQEPELTNKNIIAEPEKKNTAMAMGVAAAYIYHQNPEAVIINLATDHLISNDNLYKETLLEAANFAFKTNNLVSVGLVPEFPHTGLGYIKAGKKVKSEGKIAIYQVDSFKEKPDLETARKFIKSGNYYWNANNYVWTAKSILDEFKVLAPDLYQNINKIFGQIDTKEEKATLKREYHLAKEESIDYAISEKTKKLYVLPGKFGWNDIGDWKVVYELLNKDKEGNSVATHGKRGGFVSLDTKNCLVQTEDQLIATIGINNLIIIDTQDALLICQKDRAQDIKKLVNLLKEKKLDEYL